jgi:uncharacterized protein YbjT (DUF2867 family)
MHKILVTGATGKQGGAVVRALLSSPPPYAHEILALTRNVSSPAAKSLASKPNITLLQGDLDDCDAIFAAAGGKGAVWGVFSVQIPSIKKGEGNKEETQGKALVDAAVAHGVFHFVYSGVDRGGKGKSDVTPTEIPHFITKHNIEAYLRVKVEGTEMKYTILRPVAFMDNCNNNLFGRIFAAMWLGMGTRPLQLVACKDIGIFAALALSQPEEYAGKAITLVGDELTQPQGNEVFWKVFGRSMPRSYGVFGSLIQWMIPEAGAMFTWFVESGYGGDLAQCKRLNPGMLDLEAWYREESNFKR